MNRKSVFDTVRKMLGRGFTPAEVAALDASLDGAPALAGDDWIDLAAPIIERFEGMARKIPGGKVAAYPDPGTGGKPWTIGIGSTTDEYGKPIAPDTVWTEERARKRFEQHLREFGAKVDELVAGKPTSPAQKAALTSLAYNIGTGALAGSTVLRRHCAGDHAGAAEAFAMWKKAGGKVLPGLVRRRADEALLYRSGS